MRILIIIAMFLLAITSNGYLAQKSKLGESEIRSAETINFKNRSNNRAAYDTRIKDGKIGKKLAELILSEPEKSHTYKGVNIKRIPADKKGKFGGDIISLDLSTNFGHVNSIIRILASYIQKSLEYSEGDAETIAKYVLYYNALHRNTKSYFKDKYAPAVSETLTVSKTGISVDFNEWPGKTQIVIPIERNILKDKKSDVTLNELEREVEKVINEKKTGIEDKKKFEDLKKDKIEREKEEIVVKNEENKEKKDQLEKDKKDVEVKLDALKKDDPEKNKDKITEKEKELENIKKEIDQVTDEKTEIDNKGKELGIDTTSKTEENVVQNNDKDQGAENKKEQPTEKPKEDQPTETKKDNQSTEKIQSDNPKDTKLDVPITDNKETTKKDDQVARIEELEKELKQKKDEETKKANQSENVIDGKIAFLKTIKYIEGGHYNNEMHLIDPEKDTILKGDFNTICGNTFKEFNGNILVIGYNAGHEDAHKLFILDRKNLKEVGRSKENIFVRTPLEVRGNELYVYEEEDGKYYISKFNGKLQRIERSDKEISSDSNITFYNKKIYITGKSESGQADIRVFDKDTLKFITKINP